MAWTVPLSYTSNLSVNASNLNRTSANLVVQSTHAHTGAAGMGSNTLGTAAAGVTLTGLRIFTVANAGGSPGTAGRLQRNGVNLEYHNGTIVVGLYADGAVGVATHRTIGTGATDAAAGNHTHL